MTVSVDEGAETSARNVERIGATRMCDDAGQQSLHTMEESSIGRKS